MGLLQRFLHLVWMRELFGATREHPSSRSLWEWGMMLGRLNANDSVSFGPNGFNEGIGI